MQVKITKTFFIFNFLATLVFLYNVVAAMIYVSLKKDQINLSF